MSLLILVRHSVPEIVPEKAAHQWGLSQEGRALCIPLAETLSQFQPAIIVSSTEPKATETAAMIAHHLGEPFTPVKGLHEHERGNVPYFSTREHFQTAIRNLFLHPDELIFGKETAVQALTRYKSAVTQLVTAYPGQNMILVSHGTVMSLFVAHYNPVDAFDFWEKLKLPDFVVLSRSHFRIARELWFLE